MNAQQLKNSILQMAIQGKLVAQDPDDEPASVLLERIRAEKEKLIKEGMIKKEKNPSYIFRGEDNLPYEKVGKNEPVCITDEVPFEIPNSWEWVRVKQLLYMISGTSYKKTDIKSKGIRILRGGNIQNYQLVFDESDVFLSEEYADVDKAIKYGDIVLVASTGSKAVIGKPAPVLADYSNVQIGAFLRIARPIDINLFDWISVIFQSDYYRSHIRFSVQGTNINNIKSEYIEELLIPIPPYSEQKRIARTIEELLPSINKYGKQQQNLEELNTKFPILLKQSILQQAVMGKLVSQDPNDEPASVLLERIRAEKQELIKAGKLKKDKHESIIYRRDNSYYVKQNDEDKCIDEILPFDIPDTWCWCRLNDLCETIFDIDHNMPKADPNGVLFLSAKDLLDDGSLNFDIDVKRISRVDFERLSRKGTPRKGDIIYSRIGACLGKARIVNTNIEFLVSYSCCTIRPMIINTQYLKILLDGGFVLSQAIEKTQSIGVPDLGMQMIKDFLIPLPPLDEQRRIVEKYTCCLEIIGTIS